MNVILKFAALSATVMSLSGCLWICRVPFPVREDFSDEGVCTNRVWRSMVTDVRMNGTGGEDSLRCYYPTMKMRVVATKEMCKPINPEWKGEKLHNAKCSKVTGWIPLTLVWLTAPIDAVVDTLFIPYDMTVL